MRRADAQRGIERHLAPLFATFVARDCLLITRDGWVMRGLAVDRSQMDAATFRLRVFAQVLTIPSEHIFFDVAWDLGSFRAEPHQDAAFAAAAVEADTKGREFLERAHPPPRLVDAIFALRSDLADERLLREARAHLLVQLERGQEAVADLRVVADELAQPEVPYEEEALGRVKKLLDAIERGTARRVLADWQSHTEHALGLPL